MWEKELPFTLCEAIISDDGCVAGYGYSHGRESHGTPGDLFIVLVEADGAVGKMDKLPRTVSSYLHGLPHPLAEEIVHNISEKRVVFRVRSNDDDSTCRETWITYSLESLERISSINVELRGWIVALRSVPGTRFYLAQHWDAESGSFNSIGAIYRLYDEAGKIVWTLDKSRDFGSGNIPVSELNRFQSRTMISLSETPRQFSIDSIKDAERVSFEICEAGAVREIGRCKLELTAKPHECLFDREGGGFQVLIESRNVELRTNEDYSRPIRDIAAFDLNSKDQFGFIRTEPNKPDTFVMTNLKGEILSELTLDLDELPNAKWAAVAASDDTFVIAQSQSGMGARSRAWRIDPITQRKVILEEVIFPSIRSISGFPDGSFVVLAADYIITNVVACYNKNGQLRWQKQAFYSDAASNFVEPESLCVSSTGQVLVLDKIGEKVCIFGADGSFHSAHQLNHLWKRSPNDLSEITGALNGGYCIYDFGGQPSLILSNSSGKIVQSLTCKRDRDLDDIPLRGGPRVSSNGEVWLTNGESFYSVSEAGTATLRIPEEITQSLGTISSMTVSQERIYAQSRATGAVHVFDLAGIPMQVLSYRKLANSQPFHPVKVLPNRSVLVRYREVDEESNWIVFSSNGGIQNELIFKSREVYPLGHDRFIEDHFSRLRLVDGTGRILKQIDRQPNGNWLGNGMKISVCDQGSFAIATRQIDRHGNWDTAICTYTADGEPRNIISLGQCFVDNIDYDGERIAVSHNRDTWVLSADGDPLYCATWPNQNGGRCWLTPAFNPGQNELVMIESNSGTYYIRIWVIPE